MTSRSLQTAAVLWTLCASAMGAGEPVERDSVIGFDEEHKAFTITMANTVYSFYVNEEDRLIHYLWQTKPEGFHGDGELSYGVRNNTNNFGGQRDREPSELLAYGDVATCEVSMKANFSDPPAPQAGELAHAPVRDLRLRYRGHEILTDAEPGFAPQHGQVPRVATPRQTLCIHMVDPVYKLAVDLFYRVTPELDILERWCEIDNRGTSAVTFDVCGFATLNIPNGFTELTYVEGNYKREMNTVRRELPVGVFTLGQRGLLTGHGHNPFYLLNRPRQAWEESGQVYFGQLAFSGGWRIAFEQTAATSLRIHPGYHPFDFGLTLKPGETHATPQIICGLSPEGWGGASRRMHRFLRDRILPRAVRPGPERPVLYNGWDACGFDLNTEQQIELARKAAAIGVELFCIDDGWFGGRRSSKAGLGDWVVSPEVFPKGLHPVADEVHRLGMAFGLWVEPESVNPDSDLYRAHPDWVLHFPGRPRTPGRNQLILDFGRPEVVDTMFAALDKLVKEYKIDFFKWDMNRYASEGGSVVGREIWFRHVQGVYDLMDRLRKSNPSLMIQSCAGGGGRVDAGILGRVEQVWPSDNTCPIDRIRIQEGFSLAYPACSMESWVTDARNGETGIVSSLSTRFEVAMQGVLGIGTDLSKIPDEELKVYKSYIEMYKRIRHVYHNGDLYRLERMEDHGRSVKLYVLPDGSEAVCSWLTHHQLVGEYRAAPVLKGLKPDAHYLLADRRGKKFTLSGFHLMTYGLPWAQQGNQGTVRTWHLKEVK